MYWCINVGFNESCIRSIRILSYILENVKVAWSSLHSLSQQIQMFCSQCRSFRCLVIAANSPIMLVIELCTYEESPVVNEKHHRLELRNNATKDYSVMQRTLIS